MKCYCLILFAIILCLFALSSCRKDNNDDFFIEATINGVKWRAKSNGDFTATKSDNSQMKIFIDPTAPASAGFNFFTNDLITSFYTSSAEFELQDGYLAPFDSRLRLKFETTFEKNIDQFFIEQSLIVPEHYRIIDTLQGGGNSNTVRGYSSDLRDVPIIYLHTLKYRFFVTLTGGASFYTSPLPVTIMPGKAQIAFTDRKGKLYFPLSNIQNQISIDTYDPASSERRGTFSFSYKDESGKIIEVRNGKYHLKL